MNKNTQLFWGLATIVGAVVILLWTLGLLRRLLFWFRYKLIPGLILLAIVLGILYLGWVIFFGKDES
ncbi:MAG: hypothetical protein CV045_04335 [Cyanobacteria bacterium M5B4]|nr:MAG: hypothetical protein CV045_04335 [Cyanobacteria bacterium M5B4]